MATPIDFGKEYLDTFYRRRKAQDAAVYFAEDVVYVTPTRVFHFRSREETAAFLEQQVTEDPENYQVDIIAIKRAVTGTNTTEIVYELNLIPRDIARSIYLRCSMTVQRSGISSYEIAAVHLSRQYQPTNSERFLDMADRLSFGLMVVMCLEDGSLRNLFYNHYIPEKLEVPEENIAQRLQEDTFFMVPQADKKLLENQMVKAARNKLRFKTELTIPVGKKPPVIWSLECVPVNQEEHAVVFYCMLQDVTDYHKQREQLQAQIRQEKLQTASRENSYKETITERERELERVKSDAAGLQEGLLAKTNECDELKAQAEQQLVSLKEQHIEEVRELERQISRLESKLKDADRRIEEKKAENERQQALNLEEQQKNRTAIDQIREEEKQDKEARRRTTQRMRQGVMGIVGNSPDLQAMLDDIAAIGEASGGTESLKSAPFTFDSCMATIRRLMKGKCRMRGLVFQYKKQQGIPADLIGDKSKLQMILLDVLEYLAEKTFSGGMVLLSCSADAPVRDRVYFRFELEDSGDELSVEDLEAAFRENESPLSTDLKMLALMGGSIQIRNRQDAGSCLEITANLKISLSE